MRNWKRYICSKLAWTLCYLRIEKIKSSCKPSRKTCKIEGHLPFEGTCCNSRHSVPYKMRGFSIAMIFDAFEVTREVIVGHVIMLGSRDLFQTLRSPGYLQLIFFLYKLSFFRAVVSWQFSGKFYVSYPYCVLSFKT